MLDRIREGSKGPVAKVILFLIIITFALTGVSGYLGGGADDHVAEVNGSKISRMDFDRAYQNERGRMEEQMGDFFDTLAADENYMREFRQGVLERLIEERLATQLARDLGFRPGPDSIRETIRSMPEFQIGGQFDNDRYVALLMNAGFEPAQFRDYLEGELGRTMLMRGLVASEFVLPDEIARYQRLQNQRRSGEYIRIPVDSYKDDVELSEQSIEDYYYDNQDNYEREERVRLAYVELDFNEVMQSIEVSEDEARQYYEQNPARFTQAERREISHILIEFGDDEEGARERIENLAQRIADGEDFAELASTYSDDTFSGSEGGDLGQLERDSLDPDIEDAGFALTEEGQVSDVVRSDFGFHLIKLTHLQESEQESFAEVRDHIIENLRHERADTEYFRQQQELARISFEMPESLEPAAEALGLNIQQSDWLARQGNDEFSDATLLREAFSQDVTEYELNSELIELEQRSLVVRASDYEPATVLPLAEVRDSIVETLTQRRAQEEATRFANQLLEQYRAGEMPGALSMTRFDGLSRGTSELPSDMQRALFRLSPPQEGEVSADVVQMRNGDVAIVAVTSIEEGEVIEQETNQLREQLQNRAVQRVYQALVDGLKEEASISRNL